MADVRVKLYVSRVNFPGGAVYSFMADMGREAEAAAKAALASSPPSPWGRTGALERSIGHERRSNQYGVNLHLYASTSYARYVHQGTTGPIRPRRTKFLPVGASQGNVTFYAREVSGQSGNPFLLKGLSPVLVANGLRPVV